MAVCANMGLVAGSYSRESTSHVTVAFHFNYTPGLTLVYGYIITTITIHFLHSSTVTSSNSFRNNLLP